MERIWLLSYLLAWALIAAEWLTMLAMVYAIGRIHLIRSSENHALITDDGPDIHVPMPEFAAADMDEKSFSLHDYLGRDLVLLLLSPGCMPCRSLAGAIMKVRRTLQHCPEFLIVLEAPPEEARTYLQQNRLNVRAVADPDAALRTRLDVSRIPYGFFLDTQGIVRMKGVINNQAQLEGLISRRGRHIAEPTMRVATTTVSS